jgi:outer membrane protein assembly factor BamB
LDNGDAFLAPLQVFPYLVLETLQRQGSTGITVATRDMDTGDRIWSTELGVAASRIIVNPETFKTTAVSASGALFEIDSESVQRGYNDDPLENVGEAAGNVSYTQSVDLGDGRFAFASPQDPRKAVVYNPADERNRLRVVTLKVPSAQTTTTCPALAFDGALLMALNNGQVVNLDMVTGGDHLMPFQPQVNAGARVLWRRPAMLGDDSREFVIADNRKNIFRVGIAQDPKPHLKAMASKQLEFEVVSPLAASGPLVVGVVRGDRGDTVVAFQSNNLEIAEETPLQGRVTWGPRRVGDLVFLTTDSEGLLCYESGAKLRWKSALPHGALAGPPVNQEGQLLLASKSGFVWTVDRQTGATTGEALEVGEPLGAEPVVFPRGLLLPGSDGAVHLVTMGNEG